MTEVVAQSGTLIAYSLTRLAMRACKADAEIRGSVLISCRAETAKLNIRGTSRPGISARCVKSATAAGNFQKWLKSSTRQARLSRNIDERVAAHERASFH